MTQVSLFFGYRKPLNFHGLKSYLKPCWH
jgi:hypothetical protein